MSLSDVLTGMRNGPRGGVGSSGSSGGMSPITMGLLAFLAYKALKGSGILGSEPAATQQRAPAGSASSPPAQSAGGASDWLSGLEKIVAGGGAGTVLSGGLGELIKKFRQAGRGEVAESWVGVGSNHPVTPEDLEKAIGADTLDALAQRTGISRERILAELEEHLPRTVDTLTPDGRIPSETEAARWG